MPLNSLLEIVDHIRAWLKNTWIISSAILIMLLLCFLFWSQHYLVRKADLEYFRIQDKLDFALSATGSPIDKTPTGLTRFFMNYSGRITAAAPEWLMDVDASKTRLFEYSRNLLSHKSLDTRQTLSDPQFGLFFLPDFVTRRVAPHVIIPREHHFEVLALRDAFLPGARPEQNEISLLNLVDRNGLIIFSSIPSEMGANSNESLFSLKSGRIYFLSSNSLDTLNDLRLVVYEDITYGVFALTIIVLMFMTSLVLTNQRIQAIFSNLFKLRDELDQIASATYHMGRNQFREGITLKTNISSGISTLDSSLEKLSALKPTYQENVRVVSLLEWLISSCLKLVTGIHEKEEQFRLLTRLSPVGVFFASSGGVIRYVNQRMCDILDVPEEKLIGQRWESFIHHKDRSRYIEARNGNQEVTKQQVRCVKPDGTEIHVMSEEVFQVDSLKRFTGIIGAVTDITEIKRAETALQESEARWQFALEGSGNGVWDWNIRTGETFYSAQWNHILGYDADEIEQDIKQWKQRIHPDDLEEVDEHLNRHLNGETALYKSEHRILCKNGEYKWVLDRGQVIERRKDGQPVRMIGTHSDITERKSNEEKIQHLAYHDSLTNLPNRAFLQEELHYLLSQLKRYGTQSALLFLDIDRFKMVNDSLRHLIGDLMLKEVAQRLRESIREGDFLVRLGGDEFVILLGNPHQDINVVSERARKVALKILHAFNTPFTFEGQKIMSGTSIGIVIFPEDGQSAEEILKHADTAMYEAKKDGRNTMHFYRQELAEAVKKRVYLESALRIAIANNELTLNFQPKVSLKSNEIVGAEALVRWTHEDKAISPAEFIPVAEESGLILKLGDWVFEQACLQMQRWKKDERFKTLRYIAVNVSPLQFNQRDFVDRVSQIVSTTGIDPQAVEIELTEGVFMENVERSKQKMSELKAKGLRFAVDDFGTGYSSLVYLKQLPVDILKVDQAFVRDLAVDPNDASIVRTVLAMAQSLGMEAVAEGVESQDHIDFLKAEGCQYFQGYYFSKPLSEEEFTRLVEKHNLETQNPTETC
ncbi:MAG: EAL domain-containing protein [Pseudomonadales bacterium]|nr:EAL domain-containing protein [Pseudomonadales bacterium]